MSATVPYAELVTSARDVVCVLRQARDAERSRAKLEQKAKLYDELKKRAGELDFDDEGTRAVRLHQWVDVFCTAMDKS